MHLVYTSPIQATFQRAALLARSARRFLRCLQDRQIWSVNGDLFAFDTAIRASYATTHPYHRSFMIGPELRELSLGMTSEQIRTCGCIPSSHPCYALYRSSSGLWDRLTTPALVYYELIVYLHLAGGPPVVVSERHCLSTRFTSTDSPVATELDLK